MPDEPFYERFRRILAEHKLRPEEAAAIMQTSVDVVRRLSDNRTKQAKLDEALRLCERLGIDPWYLAFGRARLTTPSAAEPLAPDDVRRLDKVEADLKSLLAEQARLTEEQQQTLRLLREIRSAQLQDEGQEEN